MRSLEGEAGRWVPPISIDTNHNKVRTSPEFHQTPSINIGSSAGKTPRLTPPDEGDEVVTVTFFGKCAKGAVFKGPVGSLCLAVGFGSGMKIDDTISRGFLRGAKVINQAFHIMLMLCGDCILSFPEFLNNLILHHLLPSTPEAYISLGMCIHAQRKHCVSAVSFRHYQYAGNSRLGDSQLRDRRILQRVEHHQRPFRATRLHSTVRWPDQLPDRPWEGAECQPGFASGVAQRRDVPGPLRQ